MMATVVFCEIAETSLTFDTANLWQPKLHIKFKQLWHSMSCYGGHNEGLNWHSVCPAGLSVSVQLRKPEIMLFADLSELNGHALLLRTEFLIDYSHHPGRDSLVCSLAGLQILSKLQGHNKQPPHLVKIIFHYSSFWGLQAYKCLHITSQFFMYLVPFHIFISCWHLWFIQTSISFEDWCHLGSDAMQSGTEISEESAVFIVKVEE